MMQVEILSRTPIHSETSRRDDVDWLRVLGMLTVYELLIKRLNALRFLFGMKLLRRPNAVSLTH
jgi:hypothetical protein